MLPILDRRPFGTSCRQTPLARNDRRVQGALGFTRRANPDHRQTRSVPRIDDANEGSDRLSKTEAAGSTSVGRAQGKPARVGPVSYKTSSTSVLTDRMEGGCLCSPALGAPDTKSTKRDTRKDRVQPSSICANATAYLSRDTALFVVAHIYKGHSRGGAGHQGQRRPVHPLQPRPVRPRQRGGNTRAPLKISDRRTCVQLNAALTPASFYLPALWMRLQPNRRPETPKEDHVVEMRVYKSRQPARQPAPCSCRDGAVVTDNRPRFARDSSATSTGVRATRGARASTPATQMHRSGPTATTDTFAGSRHAMTTRTRA